MTSLLETPDTLGDVGCRRYPLIYKYMKWSKLFLRRYAGAAAWAALTPAQPATWSQPRPPQWKLYRLGSTLPTKYLDSEPYNIFLKEIPTLITKWNTCYSNKIHKHNISVSQALQVSCHWIFSAARFLLLPRIKITISNLVSINIK